MFIYSKLTGSLIQMQISLCLLYTYNLCDEKFVTNSQFAFNELWLWWSNFFNPLKFPITKYGTIHQIHRPVDMNNPWKICPNKFHLSHTT